MNKFKLLIASLSMVGSMSSLAANNNQPAPVGFAFTAASIGSNQYLGVYLSTPPTPSNPTATEGDSSTPATPPTCSANIQVLGMDGLPVGDAFPTQTIAPGTTVFLKVADASADSVLAPQYFNVSVKTTPPVTTPPNPNHPHKTKAVDPCAGLTGTLGVYDKVTQDLQVLLPILPAPAKSGGN